MSLELKIAIEAAKTGARNALKYFGSPLSLNFKSDKTIVTKADKETEDIIKKFILKSLPKARFVAEESGGNKNEDEFWIIDPIDGTRNFSRGISLWSVLISLCRNSEFILGVCYFPLLKLLIFAEKGKGTFCGKELIKVSRVRELHSSYIAYGSPRHFKNKQIIIDLIDATASTRCLDLSYSAYLLASGKMDALVDAYAKLWDVAPFKVIIEEAGGKLTNLQGEPWTSKDTGYIATNGLLHNQIVKIIKNMS